MTVDFFFVFFFTIKIIFFFVKIFVVFFQLLKLFFQQLIFFLVFFQQLKVWIMEESQVEAVCELRWAITLANFQGVKTSPAVQFKPTNCPNPHVPDKGFFEFFGQFVVFVQKLFFYTSSIYILEHWDYKMTLLDIHKNLSFKRSYIFNHFDNFIEVEES